MEEIIFNDLKIFLSDLEDYIIGLVHPLIMPYGYFTFHKILNQSNKNTVWLKFDDSNRYYKFLKDNDRINDEMRLLDVLFYSRCHNCKLNYILIRETYICLQYEKK